VAKSYTKAKIFLMGLAILLMSFGAAPVRADYCDYCDDDSSIYDGGFDYSYSEPEVVIQSDDQSLNAMLNDYYDEPTYSTPNNDSIPDEMYYGPVETTTLPDDVFTNTYDDYSGKPAGMTLEDYYLGDDQSYFTPDLPDYDLTTGYTPDFSYGFDTPSATNIDELRSNLQALQNGSDTSGDTNTPDFSYGFDTPSATSIDGLRDALLALQNRPDDSATYNDMTAYMGGLLQMKQDDFVYIAPVNSNDQIAQYLMYGAQDTLPSSPGYQLSYYGYPDNYNSSYNYSNNIRFENYINYTVVAPEFYGDTLRTYNIGIPAPTAVSPSDFAAYGSGFLPTYGGTYAGSFNPALESYNNYLQNGVPDVPENVFSNSSPSAVVASLPEIDYAYGPKTTRNQPVNAPLASIFTTAAKVTGVDKVIVVSGGQTDNHAKSLRDVPGGWHGSDRHDNGGSGDVQLVMKNGHVLSMDIPADRAIISAFITESVKLGATGIGVGENYMGPSTFHIGFGSTAIWGDDNCGGDNQPPCDPPPAFAVTAFNAGLASAPGSTQNVQQELKDLGYYSGNVDGINGTATKAAIVAFQKDHGLTQDGVVGSQTLDKLESIVTPPASIPVTYAPAPITPQTTTPVPTTKELQQELKDLGYYTGTVDGIYGPKTESAVAAFQKVYGLPVDGIVGPNTLDKLDDIVLPPGNIPATNKDIQAELKSLGFYSGNIDGIIGPQTISAIKAFQNLNGLPITGVVDQQTFASLNKFGDLSPTPTPKTPGVTTFVVTLPIIISPTPKPNLRPGDETQTSPASTVTAVVKPNLRPGGYFINADGQVVPAPNLRENYIASQSPATPSQTLTPNEYFVVTNQGQVVPLPHLRPGDLSTTVAGNTTPTQSATGQPVTYVTPSEPTTIPPGPYGAEVLARAILSGDPARIAAAQKEVEANAEAEIRAAYGSNWWGLLANSGAEKDKVTAAVTTYLTQTVPREAPGSVRAFEMLVQADPSIINDLTPEQQKLLNTAFNSLPPAPKPVAVQQPAAPDTSASSQIQTGTLVPLPHLRPGDESLGDQTQSSGGSVTTYSPASGNPYVNYYPGAGFSLNPPPETFRAINFGNYVNYSVLAPEFSGIAQNANVIPGATIPHAGPSTNYLFYGYPTSDYFFSPNTLINTRTQDPAGDTPILNKPFTLSDSATVKDQYVYSPKTQSFMYGYQTVDTPTNTQSTQGSSSQYYYYIPPTSAHPQPQQVTTSIPPYYIGSLGPDAVKSGDFKDYLTKAVTGQELPKSREITLAFFDRSSDGPNSLVSSFVASQPAPRATPTQESPAPTVVYAPDSGSGFQPIVTWNWFGSDGIQPGGGFNVDYSSQSSDGNTSQYNSNENSSSNIQFGNTTFTSSHSSPSLSLCRGSTIPSAATHCSFNMIPSVVRKDTPTKIYWYVANMGAGDQCSVTSSPSVTTPQQSSGVGGKWANPSGYQVTITQKTTFTLKCTNSRGSSTSVSKMVKLVPIIQEI
jgi:peptidoglycan hydrolase-like protein with peptidoglycan-binding domain